jgi:hypothetical protein
LLADSNLIDRLGGLLESAERVALELNNRARRIAKLYLAPDAESSGSHQPDPEEVDRVRDAIDPRPAYWARMENHFSELLENLSTDWDNARNDWKPDDQQAATNAWREHVKHEAREALRESTRSLGTTARAIQAIARVGTDFSDHDLVAQSQESTKARRKSNGGNKQ